MKRRLVLLAAAVVGIATASALPVLADDPAEKTSLVDGTLTFVERTVNPILEDTPTPDGWKQRHVCAWSYTADRSICVYFPWPI